MGLALGLTHVEGSSIGRSPIGPISVKPAQSTRTRGAPSMPPVTWISFFSAHVLATTASRRLSLGFISAPSLDHAKDRALDHGALSALTQLLFQLHHPGLKLLALVQVTLFAFAITLAAALAALSASCGSARSTGRMMRAAGVPIRHWKYEAA
jgi:hypothetical protein